MYISHVMRPVLGYHFDPSPEKNSKFLISCCTSSIPSLTMEINNLKIFLTFSSQEKQNLFLLAVYYHISSLLIVKFFIFKAQALEWRNIVIHWQLKENQYALVRKDMEVNEHVRLFKITLRHIFFITIKIVMIHFRCLCWLLHLQYQRLPGACNRSPGFQFDI